MSAEGVPSDHTLIVPGRIEILGKHTDYAGGESLTCASTRSIVAAVYSHDASSLILEDRARRQRAELPYENPRPAASWTTYPVAALRRVCRHFGPPARGVRIVFASNLLSASGMSSSSALVVTVVSALLGEHHADLPFESRMDLAGFAGAVESGAAWRDFPGDDGVGTRGGSQDHTAILCSREGHASLFGYNPIVCYERVAWPEHMVFAIGGSGVKARKTGGAREMYNAISRRASEVARLYSEDLGEKYAHMGAMMEAPHFDRESLRWAIPDDDLWDRYQQFERECAHVLPSAVRAIQQADWAAFSSATAESQQMASQWLGNQVVQTEALVEFALEAGSWGASSFGAGFGGAVWAAIERSKADAFLDDWQERYLVRFPEQQSSSIFLADQPGPPAWSSEKGLLARLSDD